MIGTIAVMRISWICMFVAIIGCAGDDGGVGGGGGDAEPPELAGITAAHNQVRAVVGVAPLRWNADLASLATGFVADCVFMHSTQSERSNQAGFMYIGENLFSAGGAQPTGAQVSEAWASEKSMYDYGSNSCSGVCGHYTQQVWAATTDLGCAMKDCGNGSYIVSCEYGPGGNYQGQRPY